MSRFKFSKRSLDRMAGVHPDLVAVAKRAIELTDIDFGVTEGLRTLARQKEMVAKGASKTMNSRHLTGHAIDLVAYIGKDVRFDFALYFQIADAMRRAANELNVPVVWGGCWDRLTAELNLDKAVADYVARKKRDGGRPLLDGMHFELWAKVYP